MGCSTQQHRVTTGLFHGRTCSASWSACTGAYKMSGRRSLEPDPQDIGSWFTGPLLIALTIVVVTQTLEIVLTSTAAVGQSDQPLNSRDHPGGTLSNPDFSIAVRTSGQIRRLLMLAGDVESNPGPDPSVVEDTLITGLAEFGGSSPSQYEGCALCLVTRKTHQCDSYRVE